MTINPKSPLHWSDFHTWEPTVAALFDDVEAVRSALRVADTDELYQDDPEWLQALADCANVSADKLVDTLGYRLEWMVVRAFHGCRVDDAASFAREGVRPHAKAELVERARALVRNLECSPYVAAYVEDEIAAADSHIDEGRCYAGLDARMLVEQAGHYLIYGSEFICALFGEYRHVLKRVGVPTVVELNLPVAWLPPNSKRHLAELLLGEWARLIAQESQDVQKIDFSIATQFSIPQNHVIRHWHPKAIPDPLRRPYVYHSETGTCHACAGTGSGHGSQPSLG